MFPDDIPPLPPLPSPPLPADPPPLPPAPPPALGSYALDKQPLSVAVAVIAAVIATKRIVRMRSRIAPPVPATRPRRSPT
jgi:hypothetical protein